MSTFEIVKGVEGCCLVIDGTRVAGPKPWGGGTVVSTFTTEETYAPREQSKAKLMGDRLHCRKCGAKNYKHAWFCMACGRRLVSE